MKLSSVTVSYELGETIYTGKNEDGKYISVYGPSDDDKVQLGAEYLSARNEQRPMQLNDNELS